MMSTFDHLADFQRHGLSLAVISADRRLRSSITLKHHINRVAIPILTSLAGALL